MSGSLRPTEIHKRRHRKEKRQKLRAKLANAPAHERSTLEAKLQKMGGLPKQELTSASHIAPAVKVERGAVHSHDPEGAPKPSRH